MSEVKPATDAQIATIKAGLEKAFPARKASDLAAQMVAQILLARIAAEKALNAELLEALRRALANAEYPHATSCPDQDNVCLCWVRDARAAIAKAEGKAGA